MKKFLLPMMLSIGLIAGKAQTVKDIVRIEFTTSSRGYQKQITITPQTITIRTEDYRLAENKKPQIKKTKKQDWNKLLQALKEVPIAEVPLLKSPTMNRASDGARASAIAIATNEGMIWSHEFDNEKPHEKLQPLMNVITGLDKN